MPKHFLPSSPGLVMAVEGGKAKMQHFARGQLGTKTTVSVQRMHKHSTGMQLVSE